MRHQRSDTWSYYLSVGLLNIAIGGMIYVLVQPAPEVVATATAVVVQRPDESEPLVVPARQGVPVRIQVPSLSIDLPVGYGLYDELTTSWVVDSAQAYYAATTVPANDHNGNTLIYGHALDSVFARLPYIQPGGTATITTDTGYVFQYEYQSMRTVTPDDMSVLQASGPPTLTLQTCTGLWSEYRGLFLFKFISVRVL